MARGGSSAATTMAGKRAPAATRRDEAPPIVHALGGSIGSALALLLFYPLERARIEMQSKAAAAKKTTPSVSESSSSAATPTRLVNDGEISPIVRCPDNSQLHLVDSNSSNLGMGESPAVSVSFSMNSCSIDDDDDDAKTVSSINCHDDSSGRNDFDNSGGGIVRCLLDLRERGVLYKGVKPIISTIFTRYARRNSNL